MPEFNPFTCPMAICVMLSRRLRCESIEKNSDADAMFAGTMESYRANLCKEETPDYEEEVAHGH